MPLAMQQHEHILRHKTQTKTEYRKFNEWSFPEKFDAFGLFFSLRLLVLLCSCAGGERTRMSGKARVGHNNIKVNHFYAVIVSILFSHNSNFIIWNGILLIVRALRIKVLPREIFGQFLIFSTRIHVCVRILFPVTFDSLSILPSRQSRRSFMFRRLRFILLLLKIASE